MIGITIWSAPAVDKEALIKAADAAMYEAKRAGRGQYRVMGHLLEQQRTGSR